MWNETGTFRVEFSRKIWNGPRFKMRWNLFCFVLFFELVWNVSVIPGKTERNWQPWFWYYITKSLNYVSGFKNSLYITLQESPSYCNLPKKKKTEYNSIAVNFQYILLTCSYFSTTFATRCASTNPICLVSLFTFLDNWFGRRNLLLFHSISGI